MASYLAQDSGVIWYGTWSSAANVFSEIDARECATLGAYYKKKYSWQNFSLSELVPSWRFADYMFGCRQRPNPHHMSNIKIRKHGFSACIDTEEMVLELLREMQDLKILPE